MSFYPQYRTRGSPAYHQELSELARSRPRYPAGTIIGGRNVGGKFMPTGGMGSLSQLVERFEQRPETRRRSQTFGFERQRPKIRRRPQSFSSFYYPSEEREFSRRDL